MSAKPEDTANPDQGIWDVFLDQFPRLPTADELVCRMVLFSCPMGLKMLRDGKGKFLNNPRMDIMVAMGKAISERRAFMTAIMIRHRGKLSESDIVRMTLETDAVLAEADRIILTALRHQSAESIVKPSLQKDVGLERLNEVFWDCYWRAKDVLRREAGVPWLPII